MGPRKKSQRNIMLLKLVPEKDNMLPLKRLQNNIPQELVKGLTIFNSFISYFNAVDAFTICKYTHPLLEY